MPIELKGLSREQITNLLPEGLISLCWRGSVAHGMYVPKSDPDSIDDKDVMGSMMRILFVFCREDYARNFSLQRWSFRISGTNSFEK